MGWECDSWDSGLWRKNQGFVLPSWVFYGKQVCSIYVDQQTLAFSRSSEFVSCCLWNSEEFSYLFLQDFGDFKWLRELPHCLNVWLSDKKSGFWRFWISKESFEDIVLLEGILLNLSRKFNHLLLVRFLFAEVLFDSVVDQPGIDVSDSWQIRFVLQWHFLPRDWVWSFSPVPSSCCIECQVLAWTSPLLDIVLFFWSQSSIATADDPCRQQQKKVKESVLQIVYDSLQHGREEQWHNSWKLRSATDRQVCLLWYILHTACCCFATSRRRVFCGIKYAEVWDFGFSYINFNACFVVCSCVLRIPE